MGALPVVNGQTGRALVYIAGGLSAIVLVIMGILSVVGKPIPPEMGATLTGLLMFIIGSRVSPPDVTQTILDNHTAKVVSPPAPKAEPPVTPVSRVEPPSNGDA